MKDTEIKNKLVEHAANDSKFFEERKAVFLEGYYSLLRTEIEKLELNRIVNNDNTPTDESK